MNTEDVYGTETAKAANLLYEVGSWLHDVSAGADFDAMYDALIDRLIPVADSAEAEVRRLSAEVAALRRQNRAALAVLRLIERELADAEDLAAKIEAAWEWIARTEPHPELNGGLLSGLRAALSGCPDRCDRCHRPLPHSEAESRVCSPDVPAARDEPEEQEDRETLDMLALLPINNVHLAELSNRVQAVMAARNNAEAKIERVREAVRRLPKGRSDAGRVILAAIGEGVGE